MPECLQLSSILASKPVARLLCMRANNSKTGASQGACCRHRRKAAFAAKVVCVSDWWESACDRKTLRMLDAFGCAEITYTHNDLR